MLPSIQAATPCTLVDTNTKLNPAVCRSVVGAGYSGVARYVPLPGLSAQKDIDAQELQAILGAGLGLLLVQHPRLQGWNPASHSGTTDALAAVEVARASGYLPGAHMFLDLEGIAGTAADTIAFAQAWATAIAQAGFKAGCYVGFEVPLSAAQLYALPVINSYWSDAGPRSVATRGFAIKQGEPAVTIAGVQFDPDVLKADDLQETPIWMIDRDAQAVG